ncbi:RNA polymerase sigma-70 factor (ECF subfamily) [Lewinella aquimaris]|uniref:RNA polymerase sigma-70 factor (ECF subfamily) n=1 Tax=Neolewinella aquimaris TaxID=1835722 RepID=A0A840E9N6_9BACT|nr:sigma-70 family RNA polymerase sigma factor [Neolewinella aquimaris]MBB4080057.1 RNA polymerase sigma-70 factor (ECF subfamily) [Neolewinella aquimaris]
MTDLDHITRFQRSRKSGDLLPLYQRYAELIYGWCLGYLGTAERAEDAGAEIFTVLLAKLAKHEVANFRSWLQTLVRNHCLMQLRREKRDPLRQSREPLMQSEELMHLPEEAEATPDTRPLHHCLKQLGEEQRTCIRLFYLQEGHSYQSIADQLNLSVGRVRSHLQNGRRNLKICLERRQTE